LRCSASPSSKDATGYWQIRRSPRSLSDGLLRETMDGRIDDPKGGWKAKGLWATYARGHLKRDNQ